MSLHNIRFDDKSLIFIDHVKKECKKYKVTCSLRNTKNVRVDVGMLASGYFDETTPILVCSMNRVDAIEILVHEYCHLTQWVEQIPIWKECEKSIPKFFGWLQGDRIKNLKKHMENCRELELDNEKRSVEIIKKFDLNIDITRYIKKANAYVYFYTYMLTTRRWAKKKNSPYSNIHLINSMPDYFLEDYSIIPKNIETVFIEQKI